MVKRGVSQIYVEFELKSEWNVERVQIIRVGSVTLLSRIHCCVYDV